MQVYDEDDDDSLIVAYRKIKVCPGIGKLERDEERVNVFSLRLNLEPMSDFQVILGQI